MKNQKVVSSGGKNKGKEVVGERNQAEVVGSKREYVTQKIRTSAVRWKEDEVGLDNVRSDW